MFTIKYLHKSWFSDECFFVKFNLHKISNSMMYSLPILWKTILFSMAHTSKKCHYGFLFLTSPLARPSWGLSWFWSGMGGGRFMPNLMLYSKFALWSENSVVMLLTKIRTRNNSVFGHFSRSAFETETCNSTCRQCKQICAY